jgi:hypothetical protein
LELIKDIQISLVPVCAQEHVRAVDILILHFKCSRRAGIAHQELTVFGYTNVYIAGGYADLPAVKQAYNEKER